MPSEEGIHAPAAPFAASPPSTPSSPRLRTLLEKEERIVVRISKRKKEQRFVEEKFRDK